MRLLSSANLKHVLQCWTKKFRSQNIPDPNSSAEYIIAHVLGKKTLFGVKLDTVLSRSQTDQVNSLCKKRLTRMPVQYILGEWDFQDVTLKMKAPVLIPRPETEELAELCSDTLGCMSTREGAVFLEIGPGSGAITVSLLKRFPELQAVAVDISEEACQLTRDNAELTATSDRLTIIHGDFMSSQVFMNLLRVQPFCLAVSNPPYLTTKEMESLQEEISCFEDHKALHGGEDGLDIVRGVVLRSSELLQPGGQLWLEVGESHPPLVEKLTADPDTWKGYSKQLKYEKTVTDLYGKPRFCQLVQSS
ncbi:hemK methyltransferase family member 1 [Elysia marginata]|uniref:HemK methyltransferase family member 1 n=1 Tax=Elysia marginata TaxID=1093978 RepID=A0AAV4J604_9GAST|nr:hemK methyltransferase family member 1 [Elysia marginata]